MTMDRMKGKKRKSLEEEVLAKARKHVAERDAATEEVQSILNPPDDDEPPAKKVRKPRHAVKKVKAEVPPPTDPQEKKKEKRKKKKKAKGTTSSVSQDKNAESVQRHNSDALNFLQKWKHCRSDWKFEKLKQVWLLKNCLDAELIPEESFALLLEYMSSVRGQARIATEQDMTLAMNAVDGKADPTEEEKFRNDRARQIMQMLSD